MMEHCNNINITPLRVHMYICDAPSESDNTSPTLCYSLLTASFVLSNGNSLDNNALRGSLPDVLKRWPLELPHAGQRLSDK
jgi:hypothetical protein